MTLWITGLSGSGKTTLASEVTRTLRERHLPVLFLDGDELREIFGTSANNSQSYTRQDRLTLALRYAALCRLLAEQHVHVVIATISLFREVHEWNRNNLKNYFQVYLKVPLEELARRDPKKIYSRYHAGDLEKATASSGMARALILLAAKFVPMRMTVTEFKQDIATVFDALKVAFKRIKDRRTATRQTLQELRDLNEGKTQTKLLDLLY